MGHIVFCDGGAFLAMGASQSAHAPRSADLKTRIDESVFSDDVSDVLKRIMDMRHTTARSSPFRHWSASGSPIDDLTWLAFGFDLKSESYYDSGNPYAYASSYLINDDGATVVEAERLLNMLSDVDLSTHARNVGMVTHHCLIALASNTMPATVKVAHHWMVGGQFNRNCFGRAEPIYTVDSPYSLLAQDLLEGVALLISALNVDLCSMPVHVVPSEITPYSQRNHNMHAIVTAWHHVIHTMIRFPTGLVPFWKSEFIMTSCRLYTTSVSAFSNYELALSPESDPWFTAYVDADLEFFIIFVLSDTTDDAMPLATCWVMECSVCGTVMCQVDIPTRINFGMDSQSWWSIMIRNDCWYLFNALVCGGNYKSTRATPCFPMIIELATYPDPGIKCHTLMVRCASIPENIRRAIITVADRHLV